MHERHISKSVRPRPCLLAALLVLAGGLVGCTAWKSAPPTRDVISSVSSPEGELRILLIDGAYFEVRHPKIDGDSLFGTPGRIETVILKGGIQNESSILRVNWSKSDTSFALSEIQQVELHKVDAGRTVAFAIVAGAVAAFVLVGSSSSSGKSFAGGGGGGNGGWGGSCPMIFSWTGREWVLDSGTFGGAFLRPLQYSDIDRLESLSQEARGLRLRLDAGDQETDHVDELAVLAVDHEPGALVAAGPEGELHAVSDPRPPITARDGRGRDVLRMVSAPDGRSWESSLVEADTARAEDRREQLLITFPRPAECDSAHLVLRARKSVWAAYLMRRFVQSIGSDTPAWYAKLEEDSTAIARFRSVLESDIDLTVSLWRGDRWVRQGSIWGGAPEVAKDYVIPLDLSGVGGDAVRIRIETTPSFWLVDWAGLGASPDAPVTIRQLPLESAIDQRGRDRRPELRSRDGIELTMESGESIAATFTPPAPPVAGTTRSYLSRIHGWYRFYGSGSGPVDTALARVEITRPGAIATFAVLERNRALRALRDLE